MKKFSLLILFTSIPIILGMALPHFESVNAPVTADVESAPATLTMGTLSAPVNTEQADVNQDDPLNVLLIIGGGYHNYQEQEEAIVSGLDERLNINWTVDDEAGSSTNHILSRQLESDWADGFDAVIYNNCHANTTDTEFIDGIAAEHRESGVGAIFIHCAMHTYRSAETDSWDHLVGLDTFHHENQQREFELLPLAPEHPVMADFPAEGWVSPRDEIYIILETYENFVPLAHAYGPESDKYHVVMWANTFGDARVVGATAGHNTAVIADPVYMDFLANAVEWVAAD